MEHKEFVVYPTIHKFLNDSSNDSHMKYWFIIICILTAGCVGQTPQPENTPAPETGPKTYQYLTDVEILDLIPQMSPVVLYFHSPTCSSCHLAEPLVEELQNKYNLDIIWVNKRDNDAIFDLYHVEYYPALYVYQDSEVYITFDENDSLTRIYSQILDGTITGMHKIDYSTEDNQIIIPTDNVLPDTLYYISFDNKHIFVFISRTATLYVLAGSEGCDSSWLYLKKDLIYNSQFPAQWKRDSLEPTGKMCGNLIRLPYTVTGSSIVVNVESIP